MEGTGSFPMRESPRMKPPDFEPLPLKIGRWRGWRWQAHLLLWLFPAVVLVMSAPAGASGLAVGIASILCWLSAVSMQIVICPQRPILMTPDDESAVMTVWPLGLWQDGLFSSTWRLFDQGLSRMVQAPLGNLATALLSGLILRIFQVHMSWNPLTMSGPWLTDSSMVRTWSVLWWIGRIGHAHWVLALAAALPAMPLAGGQVVAIFLDKIQWPETEARRIRRYLAFGTCIGLILTGSAAALSDYPGGYCMMLAGLLIGLEARRQARRDAAVAFIEAFLTSGLIDDDELEGFEAADKWYHQSSLEMIRQWYDRKRNSKIQNRKMRAIAQEESDHQRLDQLLVQIQAVGMKQIKLRDKWFLKRMSKKFRSRPKKMG